MLGYTLASGAFVSSLINLLAGSCSDRIRTKWGRRRPFIVVGALLSAPVLWLLGGATSIPSLVVCFCLLQLVANIASARKQIAEAQPA